MSTDGKAGRVRVNWTGFGLFRKLANQVLWTGVLAVALTAGFGQGTGESSAPEPQDPVRAARGLATSGHRAEALQLLDQRLAEKPTDSDARVLRGVILSWESRYDEARGDLQQVLNQHRDHGDALPALINVEMWSDHPDRAEQLAHDALRRNPNDPDLLLAEARTLKAMDRNRDALEVVRRLLAIDPGNQKAFEMESSLGDSLRRWTTSFDHSSEWFSDGRSPWQEDQIQFNRQTPIGSVIARFSHTNRFSSASQMVEIDAYPHIRRGTYAYLNIGYSPDFNLYPRYRFGADINQSLGHGFEGSAGLRQLHFSGNVRIYTASLSKYYGDWMFTSRVFLTPDIVVGTSHSVQFQVRRYLGAGTDYFGVRFGYGSSPVEVHDLTDIQILNSSSFAAEFNHTFSRRIKAGFHWGYANEDRLGITGLRHYLADVSLSYRF